MTVICVAICTTHSLMTEVQKVDSVEEAVVKFTNLLEFEVGELIEIITCNVLSEKPGSEEQDRAFEEEVEKLLYETMPEQFVEDYVWVASKSTGQE